MNQQAPNKSEPIQVHYSVLRELFLPCPFCGEEPNVFQVPETRYGPNAPFGWIVECKNMGCIYYHGAKVRFLSVAVSFSTFSDESATLDVFFRSASVSVSRC